MCEKASTQSRVNETAGVGVCLWEVEILSIWYLYVSLLLFCSAQYFQHFALHTFKNKWECAFILLGNFCVLYDDKKWLVACYICKWCYATQNTLLLQNNQFNMKI